MIPSLTTGSADSSARRQRPQLLGQTTWAGGRSARTAPTGASSRQCPVAVNFAAVAAGSAAESRQTHQNSYSHKVPAVAAAALQTAAVVVAESGSTATWMGSAACFVGFDSSTRR